MAKPDVSALMKNLRVAVSKHSPEILTGIGIAGMIATTIMAVRATPKAIMLVNERECEEHVEQLPKKEVIKTCWKCYIPAAVTGVSSIACLIGASSVNAKRNAALATAYTISETALREYKEKVVETIGEKKEQAVRDAIAKDKIDKDPVTNHNVSITSVGTTQCYDAHAGRYFLSDIETIRRAVNELNRRMYYDTYVSLNEFYDELDLDHTAQGDMLGWNLDNGFIDIDFSSQLDNKGNPCLVINYRVAPKYDFEKFN